MRRFTPFLAFVFTLADLAFAQVLPDSVQLEAWKNFNEHYQNQWIVRWHEETGTPATIYGFKTEPYTSIGTPEAIARQFLKQNRAIFKMKEDLSDLSLLRKLERKRATVIDFQQTYQGIPVFGGQYTVAVGKEDNAIQMAGGRYFPNVSAPTTPAFPPERGIEIALEFLGLDASNLRNSSSTLVIFPKDGPSFVLAYRLLLNDWEIIIDAVSGNVEGHWERIVHINGTGNVYPKDPVNSSLTQVSLYRLLGAGTTLDGIYVKATNSESGDAYSANRDFRYTPPQYTQHDGTHFDDANVYYHIDKFARGYWENMEGPAPKVTAFVHDPTYPDNAAAHPDYDLLYFGHGVTYFWDLAKKEDVVYHEYTHRVSFTIGLEYRYFEERAMHEGYSDYHAATYTRDPRIGEWVTRCTDTGDLRTVSNDPGFFNYNNRFNVYYAWCDALQDYWNYAGSYYAAGMIWSGALWDLRSALGRVYADRLVLEGLVYKHGPNTIFLDGREGIIIADQNYYGGVHVNTIKNVFAARGIGQPAEAPVALSGSSEVQMAEKVPHALLATPNQFALAQNFPNPFNPEATIEYALPGNARVTLKVYNVLGEEIQTLAEGEQSAGYYHVRWNGTDASGKQVPSGIYLYRIEARSIENSESIFIATRKMMLLR